MCITHRVTVCGRSGKRGFNAGPFIQTSSLTISSQIDTTTAPGSVIGCGRNVSSVLVVIFYFYLLFRNHTGAETKSIFTVHICVEGGRW